MPSVTLKHCVPYYFHESTGSGKVSGTVDVTVGEGGGTVAVGVDSARKVPEVESGGSKRISYGGGDAGNLGAYFHYKGGKEGDSITLEYTHVSSVSAHSGVFPGFKIGEESEFGRPGGGTSAIQRALSPVGQKSPFLQPVSRDPLDPASPPSTI